MPRWRRLQATGNPGNGGSGNLSSSGGGGGGAGGGQGLTSPSSSAGGQYPITALSCIVHHGKFGLPTPALDQKRTLEHVRVMSALPPKADIAERDRHVRFVPKAAMRIL